MNYLDRSGNMSLFLLYLLFTITKLGTVLFAIAVGGLVACLILFIIACDTSRVEEWGASIKKWVIICTMTLVLSGILPNKSDVAYIVGGYYVTNSPEIAQLPDNILGTVNTFLESHIAEGVVAKEKAPD
jgi:hypothetical protein